jgi:hypothetical protein
MAFDKLKLVAVLKNSYLEVQKFYTAVENNYLFHKGHNKDINVMM